MRIDPGSAPFGFAIGPLPSAPVDFTSGSTACRRASFAVGADFFFDLDDFGWFSFGTAGFFILSRRTLEADRRYQKTSRARVCPLALISTLNSWMESCR